MGYDRVLVGTSSSFILSLTIIKKFIICTVFWLIVLPSISASELSKDEITLMHEAGVVTKLLSDPEKLEPYFVPEGWSLDDLTKAEYLNFSNLALFDLPPWFSKFTNLKELDLSNTQISLSSLKDRLSGMKVLTTLKLAGNKSLLEQEGSSLKSLWPLLPKLNELDLSNLSASAKQIGDLGLLGALTKLDLSKNDFENGVSSLGLKQLSILTKLSLSSSGLNESPLQYLPTGSLKELDLSDNSIFSLPFVNMPDLTDIDLLGNRHIKVDKLFGGLFALPSLKIFKIEKNETLPEPLQKKLVSIASKGSAQNYKKDVQDYLIHTNGTVTHQKEQLMWKRCSEGLSGDHCQEGEAKRFTWDEAVLLEGSEFAGDKDWRLPTKDELLTLINCNTLNGSTSRPCKGKINRNNKNLRPRIYQKAFPNTMSSSYWSSKTNANHLAWEVGFYNGDSKNVLKSTKYYVRLVRGVVD